MFYENVKELITSKMRFCASSMLNLVAVGDEKYKNEMDL